MDKYINITKAENDPCASNDKDDAELELSEDEKPSVTVSMPVGSPTKATCTSRSPLPSTSSGGFSLLLTGQRLELVFIDWDKKNFIQGKIVKLSLSYFDLFPTYTI
jgi:hypothetical protein